MKQRLDVGSLWVIVPFLALAMSATRAVGLAWLALIPIISTALAGISRRGGRGFTRPVASVIALLILAFPFLFTSPVTLDDQALPLAAAEALADVRTFHDDIVGGYLIYAGSLAEGVFIDDRVELYKERIAELVEVRAGVRPWEPVFERDRIEQTLLRAGEPLIERLTSVGWAVTYQDDNFVVLAPSSS